MWFFVCHYMEGELRAVKGEGFGVTGWPNAGKVRQKLQQIVNQVQGEVKQMKDVKEILEKEKEKKEEDTPAKGSEVLEDLAKKAKESLEKGTAPGASVVVPVEPEDLEAWAEEMLKELTEGHQAICLKVKAEGVGVCSRCHWRSGCHSCHFAKAVRYYRDRETGGFSRKVMMEKEREGEGEGEGAEEKQSR